jgi:nucleoside-diphosphate-sugar epimerase
MIDVRDAMSSYWHAACMGESGEVYNLGGTKSISVGEFLEVLKKLSRKKIKSKIEDLLL